MRSRVQQRNSRKIEEQVQTARERVTRRHMYPHWLRQI